MMVGLRNTSIFSILLLAIIHEGIQTPLHPLGEEPQIAREDEDENGSLTDKDFLNALSKDFINNEPDHDEDSDPNAFEGDIQGDKEELRAARALVNNREVVAHPGSTATTTASPTVPPTVPPTTPCCQYVHLVNLNGHPAKMTCETLGYESIRQKEECYVAYKNIPDILKHSGYTTYHSALTGCSLTGTLTGTGTGSFEGLICKTCKGGSYTIPTEEGYCGFSAENDDAHEFCLCEETSENYEALCRLYCNNDYSCKGYDYTPTDCAFYTVSSCPTLCPKLGNGNIGSLVNKPSPNLSGCYIKVVDYRTFRPSNDQFWQR